MLVLTRPDLSLKTFYYQFNCTSVLSFNPPFLAFSTSMPLTRKLSQPVAVLVSEINDEQADGYYSSMERNTRETAGHITTSQSCTVNLNSPCSKATALCSITSTADPAPSALLPVLQTHKRFLQLPRFNRSQRISLLDEEGLLK